MTLKTEIEGEKSWEQFTLYFDQINQNFTTELLKKHPTLTQNDLRMCTLTRLNMSNKEMAALLNISVLGIEKSRYRLKKRLNLSVEEDLDEYLRAF
jgi:DNA-binding CsgD family transcriptional regulator